MGASPSVLKNRKILVAEQDGLAEAYLNLKQEKDPECDLSVREALEDLVWMVNHETPKFEAMLPELRQRLEKMQAEDPDRWLDIEIIERP